MIKKRINLNNFYVLDIETSTEYYDDGMPARTFLAYGVCSEFYIRSSRVIHVHSFKFRQWEELDNYLTNINEQTNGLTTLCFVHNLSYEFSFLQANLYNVKEVLAISSHKPISCVFNELPNIEFRCTYQLSGMSLNKMGKLVALPKLESEYRYITPNDDVTSEEWEYCERDTLIPAFYIEKLIKTYDLITLPLTKTGFVRKSFKAEYKKTEGDQCKWDEMPSIPIVKLMSEGFYGGITISNPKYTGIPLTDIQSFDETSAYPFVMLTEKFPQRIKMLHPDKININKPFIARLRITNIKSKFSWAWIPIGRMSNIGEYEAFNGKLLTAQYVEGVFSDIDLKSIRLTYNFDNIEIIEGAQCYGTAPLPDCYQRTIFKYAEQKSQLKQIIKGEHTHDDEFNYVQAKANLNSIYGMCVEKLVKPTWKVLENGEWEQTDGEYKFKKHVGRSFLFGVYITAYARYNLLNAIVTNCSDTFVYADTDSIKFIHNGKPFIDTNKCVTSKCPQCVQSMGRFDDEGVYDTFITWGAKKYAYTKDGPAVNVVIAGLPKSSDYPIKNVEDLKCGTIFTHCKFAHKYIPECALYYVDYTLDITDNDKNTIEMYDKMRRLCDEN